MRPQDLPIRLLAELVFELIDKLPSAERRAFQPKLVELSNLLQDGRKVQWSAERRENHSKVLSEVWSSKRFSEILYLRRNDKITELSGLEAASKALGVKPHSIRCQLSVGRGIATYQRGGSRWVLAKTRELAEEAHLLKFRETGNPDDIIQDHHPGFSEEARLKRLKANQEKLQRDREAAKSTKKLK